MNTITPAAEATVPHSRPDIDQKVGPAGAIIFTGLLAIGLLRQALYISSKQSLTMLR
jgi:hypothetical protein